MDAGGIDLTCAINTVQVFALQNISATIWDKLAMEENALFPIERIDQHILLIRGHKVILSTHLAELYDVEVR